MSDEPRHPMGKEKGSTGRGTLAIVYLGLLGLLGLTAAAAYLSLGPVGPVVAYGIALTKAVLIAMYFMHLKDRVAMTRVFALAPLAWLLILLGLTLSDPLTRSNAPAPPPAPSTLELPPRISPP